ncbi:MAG: creatininase family protein [Acidimicrobiales bacterium]|nr:creatininase family protein [Acidimicrobiales bacterium]
MAGFLDDLTGPEAERVLAGATVLVPVGAVEQHGPHLPLSVDYVIADAAAKAVVARLGDDIDVWAIPTLPYSKSNEHAWSKGTIWLSESTMDAMLGDIAACVAKAGAKRLVFLNGHGGNTTQLNVVLREARLNHGLLTFLLHPFVPPAYSAPDPNAAESTELGMGIHGGQDETSVMMHLRPDLVDMSKAVRNVPEWLAANDHVKFGGSVQFGWLSNDFGDVGHIGDPTGASAELGARLFDEAVGFLCDQLREIVTFDFTR